MKHLGFLLLAVAAVGCGKKGGDAAKPLDVAGVNALVPASLKDKLVFEERKIEEERGKRTMVYTVAAPKGWGPGFKGFAQLKPDDKNHDSFMTKFNVGTNCDGACEPKDWSATVGKVYDSYLKGKVIKDEKGKNSRTIIAESGEQTIVVVATWDDGASKYKSCDATLDKAWAEAAPAFEKACQVVNISEK
jgi:hypothetical protein